MIASSLDLAGLSFIINETGGFLHASHGLPELLLTSDEQLRRLGLNGLVSPDEQTALASLLKDVLDGKVQAFEWAITRGDREIVLRGEPLRRAEFAERCIVGIAVDQTLLQHIHAASALSESKYREIFNATSEAIVIHRLDGSILDINDAWCQLNGLKREEAIGLNADQLPMAAAPYAAEDAIEKVRCAVQIGPQTFEWLTARKDGSFFWSEVTLRVSDISGERRIVAVARDIRERKRTEEERRQLEGSLRQAQRMESIGRLAGGVAHDFNNLLTAINGNILLAIMDGDLGADTRKCLTDATKAVESAAKVTRQLLAFSRKQVIQPKVLSINDVILRLQDMLERLLGEDVRLRVNVSADLGLVEIDEAQLEQVLVNLAVNARDAMPNGGTLTLETANVELGPGLPAVVVPSVGGIRSGFLEPSTLSSFIRLSVTDTGIGMSSEVKQHLFEPFFTTKEVGKGTGLGLAMVYGVVQQNHGQIVIDSEPGQGTHVHVYIPRVNAPTSRPVTRRNLSAQAGKETIVVVEDAEPVRAMAVKVLRRQGYRVYDYPNGEEALAELSKKEYEVDLLLTDVVMPGINGLVLAERVQVLLPNVRVLYTSGYSEEVMADRGVRKTGIEFLEKPYTIQSLASRVRDVLDRSNPE
jgi:two-component system, cell cycle sensor histidine kinase and response regulator CckA